MVFHTLGIGRDDSKVETARKADLAKLDKARKAYDQSKEEMKALKEKLEEYKASRRSAP